MIGCGSFRFDNFAYRLLKAVFSINHTIWLTNPYCLRAQMGFRTFTHIRVKLKLEPCVRQTQTYPHIGDSARGSNCTHYFFSMF